jgi:hypothetical protein
MTLFAEYAKAALPCRPACGEFIPIYGGRPLGDDDH